MSSRVEDHHHGLVSKHKHGDFNFIKSPKDRNKPSRVVNDMLLFNENIKNLGFIEISLKGRNNAWSNVCRPLIEKLDLFLTSRSWIVSYFATFVFPLVKRTALDHLPCLIIIGIKYFMILVNL
jgi:hypothetical protein